jgi:hydroxymethylbilane synthase
MTAANPRPSLLRIATRRSPLAKWQAEHVAQLLKGKEEHIEVQFVEVVTQGDRILDSPLAAVGGKGLFVKEVEEALLDGRADLAVHSLKDVPAEIPAGLMLAAYPRREDPRDALVSARVNRLADLPQAASVGTSSLRRACQLLAARPDVKIISIRGNVQTRVQKIKDGLAGGILAAAGLKRLGLESEIKEILDPTAMMPAAGQGILGLEIRADDASTRARVEALSDPDAWDAGTAERAFLGRLGGGCQVPVAAHATIASDVMTLVALVGWPDGHALVRGERRGSRATAAQIGKALAEELLDRGAGEMLKSIGNTKGSEV